MVGTCAHDTHSDALFLVIAGISVDDVKTLAGVEIVAGQVLNYLERCGAHGHVDRAPSDFFLTDGVGDDTFGGW